jgi:O-antigen/teichoic acid export membrane protein
MVLSNIVFQSSKLRALFNIAMLYAGKTSGFLVIFLFLPLYKNLLGSEQFGIIAVILSLQAMVLMLDLGLSTIISRDVAAKELNSIELVKLVATAEMSLFGFYLLLILILSILKLFFKFEFIYFKSEITAVLLFFFLVLQNIYYSAMLACREFITSTTALQFFGIVVRSLITWFVLNYFQATVFSFIVTQLIVSIIHSLLMRTYLFHLFNAKYIFFCNIKKELFSNCLVLLGRSRPLLLSAAAGAAAMQVDKPLISFFISATDVTPYFLAVIYSSIPLTVLAGPIVQYFQPRIINNLSSDDSKTYKTNLTYFILSISMACIAPVIILFYFNHTILLIWLGSPEQISLISSYCKILLIAYSIATIGYIPYVIIIAKQDYKFQANTSITATIILICLLILSTFYLNIYYVCYSYLIYNLAVTTSFVIRTLTYR